MTKEEYENLNIEVKSFEPKKSLTDNADGLTFYKKIYQQLDNLLNKGGLLLLEIGLENQKRSVEKIFFNKKHKWYKDLNNNYRVIKILK